VITPSTFVYRSNFPNVLVVTDTVVQGSIDYVNAVYSGVFLLWAEVDQATQYAKRIAAENLLVAWRLSNLYPSELTGVVSNGGLPLSTKSVGGTSLAFRDMPTVQDALSPLMSNTFGMDALTMILSAPERFTIYG
jgi:hypothetical protein